MDSKQKKGLIGLVICVILSFCFNYGIYFFSFERQQKKINAFILNNKFQEALETAAKSDLPNKEQLIVMKAESKYWADKNQLDKSISIIKEMKNLSTSGSEYGSRIHDNWTNKDLYDLGDEELNHSISQSSIDILSKLCENGDRIKANNLLGWLSAITTSKDDEKTNFQQIISLCDKFK